MFNSSVNRGQILPFHGPIGVGKSTKEWDECIVGLCKGAKATLVIPSDMVYGYGPDPNDAVDGTRIKW